MNYSRLHKKILYIDLTTISTEGTSREQSFRKLDVEGSVVTSYLEVTGNSVRSCTYANWLLDKFEANTTRKNFSIGSTSLVPDYVVSYTVEKRLG